MLMSPFCQAKSLFDVISIACPVSTVSKFQFLMILRNAIQPTPFISDDGRGTRLKDRPDDYYMQKADEKIFELVQKHAIENK